MFLFIFALIIGYLSGSICSAVVVSRLFSLPDPRSEGSKNPGATNVLRLAGKKYAAMVLIADMLKGLLPVLLIKLFGGSTATMAYAGLAAVFGHMYPVFFGFKGGKGVATAMGALLGLHLMLGVAVMATWFLVLTYKRYASLASITALSFAPFYSLLMIPHVEVFLPLFFMSLFILYQHRNNITRLTDGTEPRVQFKERDLPTEIAATIETQAKETESTDSVSEEKQHSDDN